jgi:hypothetical protein
MSPHAAWLGCQGNNTTAFAALAVAGHPVPAEAIGDALADAYNALHDEDCRCSPMRTRPATR